MPDHTGTVPEIYDQMVSRKSSNNWKLNNQILNDL